MSTRACARLWQIEAAHDGRLTGKDLQSALRHREMCAECTAEAKRLSELSAGLTRLPAEPLDAVTARRVRQNLLAAFNETVLESAPAHTLRRSTVVLAFGLCAAVGLFYFWVGRTARPTPASTSPSAAVEVRASAGTRYTDRVEPTLERVEIAEGSAALTVHPHPNRKVLIALPDGEIEDLGTIFQVRVTSAHTEKISVTAGRIEVRLSERAPFTLGAGESWQREPAAATDSAAPASTANAPNMAASAPGTATSAPLAPPTLAHPPGTRVTPSASAAPSATPSVTAPSPASSAEDDAYLAIIASLRRGKSVEARALAKSYLLQFPNGFRRVEVLNIATRDTDGGSD